MAIDLLNKQLTLGDLMSKLITNTNKMGPATAEVLQQRIILTDQYWEKCLATHHQLCLVREELKDDEYFMEDLFSKYETYFIQAKAELTTRLANKIGELQSTSQIPPQSSVVPVHINSTASSLPKLSLPKFSGVQTEWDSFKERFSSLVKDQTTLTPVLKLQHLLACLEGDAAGRLRNLEVIGSNFEVAWAALLRRYDNKRLKLAVQFNKLLSMQQATSRSVSEITRFMDISDECRRALRLLDRPVDQWDDWFVHLIVHNLDADTRESWERTLEGSTDFPTYQQLTTFLEGRIQSLDAANCHSPTLGKFKVKSNPITKGSTSFTAHHSTESTSASYAKTQCLTCKDKHHLAYCQAFARLGYDKKMKTVKDHRLCHNCLRSGHLTTSCPSSYRCRHCGKPHHSLLHAANPPGSPPSMALPPGNTDVSNTCTDRASHTATLGNNVLLGTVRLLLESKQGDSMVARALIDPGSEGSFVSERVARALSLTRQPSSVTISGVGGEVSAKATSITSVIAKSRVNPNSYLSFSAAVLPRLTALLPRREVRIASWDHLRGLSLADPDFDKPAQIDCIIGAEVYPMIIRPGLRRGPSGSPIAQHTSFGWVLIGPTELDVAAAEPSVHRLSCATTVSLSTELRRFWEIEDLPSKIHRSPAQEECEAHFMLTHKRDGSGRYIVSLPFSQPPVLADSRSIALQRLLSLERRLARDENLREAYTAFVEEYGSLHHLEDIPPSALSARASYYLPHHAVVSADRKKKLRVVFNASQVTASGLSLNDCLHAGEALQANICTIITRWRLFQYVFTADIVKMFRQILIDPADATWQRILWRRSPEEQIKDLWLLTVTYGTASAPFLALRVLKQLAADEGPRFPLGADILLKHMYADDACAGGDSLEEARSARDQLIGILATAGMSLDKWAANEPTLLPTTSSSPPPQECFLGERDAVSILGLRWSPTSDTFSYKVQQAPVQPSITKRAILSEVARLYDPLGWLTPVTIVAKLLLQELWISGHDWDAIVGDETQTAWKHFRSQLSDLENLRLPRRASPSPSSSWELHGFSDASEKAYAAAVYLVTSNRSTGTQAVLLAAKSKVAPIKTVSLPRLELCGALLLARLLTQVREDLQGPDCPIVCWTDSQVVLAWLRGLPNSWHTFVANRVSEILTSLPEASWRHVRSSYNPADCASRGLPPPQLLTQSLWWHGPPWLTTAQRHEDPAMEINTTLERKVKTSCLHTQPLETIENISARFSSWRRLLRVVAYMRRWLVRIRSPPLHTHMPLSAAEIEQAKTTLLKAIQQEHCLQDVSRLHGGRPIAKDSRLRRLRPFLDAEGLLRVGGRLHFSPQSFSERHPIIVPKGSHIADLLIKDAHQYTLHGGPQLVLSHLLRSYWIIHARNRVRQAVRRCVTCTRYRARPLEQQMAPLPAVRLAPSRPFTSTGVDYAGPLAVRTSKGRGHRSEKGYVAVFVCMVTRAVHLEVVSDYTAPTFLLAFKRFTSRRGLCREVFSDNGTTFKGADSELRRLFHEASSFSQEVSAAVADDGTTWHFIPPRAPHFGGLWEAAVKCFKHHLRRVVGEATLTFEELTTLCAQIEACLNSRPVSPLSSDPDDIAALTPGHFLIGSALIAPPEPFSDFDVTGLRRWQMICNMRNHFWSRWRKEALHHLQLSSKWFRADRSIQVGDLVLMKDELQPPQKWSLARITDLHPGPDGLTRVVTLRTPTTTLTRPIGKVIPLSLDSTEAAVSVDPPVTAGGAQLNTSDVAKAGGASLLLHGPHEETHEDTQDD